MIDEKLLAKRPTRTSYSAISTHELCGWAYYLSHIVGLEGPSGPAADRGTRLHKSGEMYLLGELPEIRLPVDYWRVKGTLRQMKDAGAKPEGVVCVDRTWKVVPKNHKTTFIKVVIDVHWLDKAAKVLHVSDLKTGKIYTQEHTDQLQLYGTVGLCKYPQAKEVRVGALYIDQGREDTKAVYPRKMLPNLIEHWTERALKPLTDTEFKPKPSTENCKWCDHNPKRGRGGSCAYGV